MKRQFTLIEMLIVVTIIGILAALLAPSLRKSLDSSRLISCLNNMKQIGVMFHAYGNDYGSRLPATTKFEHGNWDSYRAGFFGAEGSALEYLMMNYGGYGEFDAERASGSETWICPAGTLRLAKHSSNGLIYTCAKGTGNKVSGGVLNSYQTAMHEAYTAHIAGEGVPAVFSSAHGARMRLDYFPSRQPLQYCSARAEMQTYNGYNSGRSNHERNPKGVNAPRPLLYIDGSAAKLQHIAWLNHYESDLFSAYGANQLHRGPYSGYSVSAGAPWTSLGLLPNYYPAGNHKPYAYIVIDP